MKKTNSLLFALVAIAFMSVAAPPIDSGPHKAPKIEKSQLSSVDFKTCSIDYEANANETASVLFETNAFYAVCENVNLYSFGITPADFKEPAREIDSGIHRCSVIKLDYIKSHSINYTGVHISAWLNKKNVTC